jgi:hypothetical protein
VARYDLPPETTAQEVIDFFVNQLGQNWCNELEEPNAIGTLSAHFQRQGLAISISTTGRPTTGRAFSYGVTVGAVNRQDPLIDECDR